MTECVERHQRRDGEFVACREDCPLRGWRGSAGDEQWGRPWDDEREED